MTIQFDRATVNPAELLDWPDLRVYVRGTGRLSLSVADLTCLESEVNYCWLHCSDGRRLLLPRTLKFYHAQLPEAWFIRLHRRYIINRRFIERVEHTGDGPCLHLTTGMSFPIARRRWQQVRQQVVDEQSFIQNLLETSFDLEAV